MNATTRRVGLPIGSQARGPQPQTVDLRRSSPLAVSLKAVPVNRRALVNLGPESHELPCEKEVHGRLEVCRSAPVCAGPAIWQ